MQRNIGSLLKENSKRNTAMFAPYDPLLGIGSPIKRKELIVAEDAGIFLPESMFGIHYIKEVKNAGGIFAYAQKIYPGADLSISVRDVWAEINKIRVKHDFEYWGSTCVTIQDKNTKEEIKFILRKPQRKLLRELEDMRLSGVPIRIILLKARQWGGSTLVQLYMSWIQLFHHTRWHSAIVGDVDEQARNIRGMYEFMAKKHPVDVFDVKFKNKFGSPKNKTIVGRECNIDIGSMQKPDSLRSADYSMAHFSEVGIWKATKGKTPEDLIQGIRVSIAKVPDTLIVLESTAKGVGNFFHREWQAAEKGLSGYRPVFVAYFEIETYRKPVEDYESFIATLSEQEWEHWDLGATLEAIAWYRQHKADENMDDWRMQSEFPATALEAFATTGRRAFAPKYVRNVRRFNREPIFIGEVYGNAPFGEDALKNIEFHEQPNGMLRIWEFPDTSKRIANRYIIPVDIGGRTHVADFSTIRVIDRAPLLDGGVPEAILTWRGHLDQDLVIWKAAQIAKIYGNGELIPETNSLKSKDNNSEGDHIITVLDELLPHYDNIYMRTDPEKVRQGAPAMYGWHTNTKTKTNLVNNLNKSLRTTGYIENDAMVCDEYDSYEIKPDGTYGAVEGQHDDLVMVTGIGLERSNTMDAPAYIIPRAEKKTQSRTAASF